MQFKGTVNAISSHPPFQQLQFKHAGITSEPYKLLSCYSLDLCFCSTGWKNWHNLSHCKKKTMITFHFYLNKNESINQLIN